MRYKTLKFTGAIERWDEALPLGNGGTGCLVWGTPEGLRFSLDRTDIWDRTVPKGTEAAEFTYRNLVRLACEGNTEEIRRIFDAPYQHPAPTKLPAGKLILRLAQAPGLGQEISQELDLELAEARITLGGKKGADCLRAICHATEGTGMIWTGAAAPVLSVELENPQFGSAEDGGGEEAYDPRRREISQGSLKKLRYPAAARGRRQGAGGTRLTWFTQRVDREFAYGIAVAERSGDRGTEIFWRICTSRDCEQPEERAGEPWMEEALALLEGQIEKGYEFYLESHGAWWREYWEKSGVELPEELAERQWYLTNYLFASCSRRGSYPMPLQGVWTADDDSLPPWKGDYHNDLNTQLSYSHFYKANHLEEGSAFLDFLWSLRAEAQSFARRFYGTPGLCLPGVMTIDGKPLGGWPMYSLSPTQQIWLCRSFEQYWRCTGDGEFLRERAWPYFCGTAECIGALLEEGEDGLLYLPVSSSPEIHDDEAASWVTPNSNYDLALLRYLYGVLLEMSELLGESGKGRRWKSILEKLPQLAVDGRGVLMLSPDEILRESHRHLSNAMAISPLELIGYEKEEERRIVDAVVADYELLGTGLWVGFSFCWMSHLYAVQGNGEGAWDRLKIFWESFCSPNGFHLNGDYRKRGYSTFHYRPFTLEANMFAADALQEMLFYMKKGRIRLFPAVPQRWREEGLAFRDFRGEGGVLVSARLERGRLKALRLRSSRDQQVTVEAAFGYAGGAISLKAGESWSWEALPEAGEPSE